MKPSSLLVPLLLAAGLAGTRADEASALAVLASEADVQAKAMACNELSVVGTARAVPALAALLGDEKLNDYARTGLEVIDDPAAGRALLDALPKLDGRLLAGVVTSLGNRGDAAAVPALQKLATTPAGAATAQALASLGMIASDEAVETLVAVLGNGPPESKVAAAHAALVAAERMQKAGRPADALLDAVAAAEVPAHIRNAAAARKGGGKTGMIFDGDSFDGWEGDLAWFRIENRAVVAGSLKKKFPATSSSAPPVSSTTSS